MRYYFIGFIFWIILAFPMESNGQQLIEYQEIAGIEHTFQHETFIGGGAAFFDYDNDGDDDLYLTSGNRPDIFYENNGNGTFTEKTDETGLFESRKYNTMGVIAGDIDNDGYKDLFVTTKQKLNQSFGKNLLFHNNGDGSFTDIWPEDVSGMSTWSISATFLDYNLDGLLDIYVGNYVKEANILRGPDNEIIGYAHECFENQFYENKGAGEFTERSSVLGLKDNGCALAVTASDYDNDGDMDLLLANDFGPDIVPNRFFRNDLEAGKFVEIGAAINADQAIYGMGIGVGDYDNDLDLDYYITNNGSNLLLQNEAGQFVDAAMLRNAANTWNVEDSTFAVGWGCSFLDIDNDMDLDIYISNGFVPGPDYLPTNIDDFDQVLLNNGAGTFLEDSSNYFVDNSFVSRGMAYSDIDKDGDLDILSVIQKAPVNATRNTKLFLNQLRDNGNISSNNWLQIKLTGVEVNRDAYGSKIYLYAGGKSFLQELSGGASHCSHSSSIIHFGLNNIELVDSIKIVWTGNSKTQTHYAIPANRRIFITENEPEFTTPTTDIAPKGNIVLYPNPTDNQLFVDFTNFLTASKAIKITVFSITGKEVISANEIAFPSTAFRINTADLTAGIYLLKVTSEEDSHLLKFIKN